MDQLERHKALYQSINSYSQDIARETPGLSPLVVLKTAIQLHQQEPRAEEPERTSSKALPLMQAPIQEHNLGESSQGPAQPLQLEEKLNQLKAVLPSVSDEKLAVLLACEKGDMNAVVQCILDSEPTEYEVSSPSYDVGQCRVIDLSSEATNDPPVPESSSTTESILFSFLQIDVETSTLTKILETVKENEGQS